MRLLGLCVAALLLTACGGTGAEVTKAASKPSAVATTAPTPTEAADCRTTLGTVDQIVDSMESEDLAYGKFTGQAQRLRSLQDRAATTCSPAVMRPLSLAGYKFSLAAARWSLCDADCDMTDISQNVHSGQDLLRRSVARSQAHH